jgi:outer membrane protein assembly factor BamD (BamD/ComL family)
MMLRWFGNTAASALLLLTGCVSNQAPLPEATQLLEAAEADLQAGSYGAAINALAPVLDEACPARLLDRRDLALARAYAGVGEPWDAYLILEKFSDLHPLSALRPQAVELLWSIGNQLITRDGGFLFFWSDRTAGRIVLEHLITRHPDTRRLADALRILGDMAFDQGDYELAQARYRDIILDRPDSDWRFYAKYRFAMSIVAGLRGPDYDLDRMQHAVRELRGFLNTEPESPQMLAEAERALTQVLSWQVQRHVNVVGYYRRLDNLDGQLHHAMLATQEEFRGVPGYEEALLLRASIEAEAAGAAAQNSAPGGRP